MKRDESRSETDFGALAGLNGLGAHAKTAQNCPIWKPQLVLFFKFQLDSGGAREPPNQLSFYLIHCFRIDKIQRQDTS